MNQFALLSVEAYSKIIEIIQDVPLRYGKQIEQLLQTAQIVNKDNVQTEENDDTH